MMRAFLLTLALAFAALAPAHAQPAAPARATPAPVAAAQWRVDPQASSLGFASSVEGAQFRGVFTRWVATIRFDPANLPGSSIRVVVDPTSASSGLASRDATLKETDWFDTRHFPQAVFQSASIRAVSPGRYEAVGVLTVKGRATPVTLAFALTIAGANADAQGGLTLDRSRLGLGGAIGPDMVPLAVDVAVRVKATRM
jgi:polyisoprenoid-binding protein YceI